MRQRLPRIKDDAYLAEIRQLPCIVCGDNTSTEAAHIRYPDLRVDKRPLGNSEKSDDRWALPQCSRCHREQHALGNERRYWKVLGIDPILYALALFSVRGDHEAQCRIVDAALREGATNPIMAG